MTRVVTEKTVKVQSTARCPGGIRAKRFALIDGFASQGIDIDKGSGAAGVVMMPKDGRRHVPTFDVKGGYDGGAR